MQSVTKTITSVNSFTDAIAPNHNVGGSLALRVAGSWTGTVTLQCSFDSGTTWDDSTTYTTNTIKIIVTPVDGILYRVGVKNEDSISGTVEVGLYK